MYCGSPVPSAERPPRRGTPSAGLAAAGPDRGRARMSGLIRLTGDGLMRRSRSSVSGRPPRPTGRSSPAGSSGSPRRQLPYVLMSCSSQNAMPSAKYRSRLGERRRSDVDGCTGSRRPGRPGRAGRRRARSRSARRIAGPTPGPWMAALARLGVERVAEHVRRRPSGPASSLGPPARSHGRVVVGARASAGWRTWRRPRPARRLGPSGSRVATAASAAATASRPAAQAPQDARQPAQRVALAQPVAGLPPQRQRALARPRSASCHRSNSAVLVGAAPSYSAASAAGSGPVREPQGPLVLGRRLPVRRQPGRLARRGRARSAARPDRRRPPPRGRPAGRRRRTRPSGRAARIRPWMACAAVGRDGLLHGEPGDLVAEPQPPAVADEQPGGEQFVDSSGRRAGSAVPPRSSPQLDPGAGQRGHVEHARGPRRRAAATRASTASRADGGTAAGAGPQHLGDVERVSAGQPVQLGRSPGRCRRPAPPTASADSGASPIRRVDRWEASSPSASRSGSLGGQGVIAVGGDQQHRRRAQPPTRGTAAGRASTRRPSGGPPARRRSAGPAG